MWTRTTTSNRRPPLFHLPIVYTPKYIGWDSWTRTNVWRYQKPLPYQLGYTPKISADFCRESAKLLGDKIPMPLMGLLIFYVRIASSHVGEIMEALLRKLDYISI